MGGRHVLEQAEGRLVAGQRREFGAVAVVGAAAFERPISGEQDVHVVVGVVSPPDAHARGSVEAEVLPGAPEGFEAADCFGVFPPLRAPGGSALDIDLASVRGGEFFADERGNVGVKQFGLCSLVFGQIRGRCVGSLVFVVPLPHAVSHRGLLR